ncbi:MAG TPA: protein kinase [Povalibacter sp.]|uniref:serine/threonine-protein kinase n=1 Tax=Povalibacter sp. TaxID=1962978 RepID=UPI002C8901D8|nr:protein kinase [Povalibacter sp.]HMN44976.1 protein kinase [Povalibacter sp.]
MSTITIPGYRIERRLGQGGMATVYLAIQESFGREVALKVMSPLLNSDPTFATRFMREARIVAHMHHASIVPVFDVGERKPHHYLSMEYLPGGDLKQRILHGRGGADLLEDICRALCPALDLAHRKGFIHRDIKPENILFREDGTPVLTDFGIARAVDSGTSLTMAGMFVGTPSYMSPEQVKGQELDGRSDLYSLGIVCYEILTGTLPFRADSSLSVALKHLSEPLPTLPAKLASYQPFLDRLTAKERTDRFANGADVLRALRSADPRRRASDVTLLREMPEALRTQANAGALPTARKAALRFASLMKEQWAKRPALPRITISRKPVIDRRIALHVGTGIAAAMIVATGIRSLRDGEVEPAVVEAAQPTPATPAPQEIPATAQVADSAGIASDTPPEPSSAAIEPPDPVAAAAEAARLAEARAARQRELEEKRQRAAEQQAAAQHAQQERIQQLLAEAKDLYARGALALPSGASAADRYHDVLQLQPDQPEARAGQRHIADVLAKEAEHAQSVRDADALRSLIPQIAWVQPGHPSLVRLQSGLTEIEAAPAELSRREAANIEKAAKHVAKAYKHLDRTPYDLRAADAATDEYDRASSAVATAPGLPVLRERLIASYSQAVRTELNDGDTRNALRMIEYARKRKWMSPDLERLETNIRQGAVAEASGAR